MKKMKLKKLTFNYIYSLFITIAIIFGYTLDKWERVNFSKHMMWILILLISIVLTPVITFAMGKIELICRKRNNKPSEEIKKFSLKYFLIRMSVIVACYIPVWLSVWPGFFNYDAETEVYMVFTDRYSQHHPLVHELLLANALRIGNRLFGNYNAGIAIYIGIQMILVSAFFAYMLTTLRRMNVPQTVCNICWAFMGLFPTVSMFALCSSKDVLFTVGVVLLGLIMLEFAKGLREKHLYVLFAVGSLLVLFFRKNGIYAYPFLLIAIVLVYIIGKNKNSRKYFIGIFSIGIGSIAAYFLITNLLVTVFHAAKDEEAEKLCVPMQQIARVYNEKPEVWSDEEKEVVFSLIPEVILQKYNPKLADNVKVNFLEDNYKSDKGKYRDLWWKTFKRCPDIYINSVLMNTYGYWYPNTILSGYEGYKIVEKYYGKSCYFAFVTEPPGVRHSYIPWLERFYEIISLEVSFQKIPVVAWLFSIGFWLWAYAFQIWFLAQNKSQSAHKMLLCFIIPTLLLMTNMLGPIALVRYVLFYFFGVPIFAGIWFVTE